jgi:Ca2+-binding EF-hand superfamily protein
LLSCFTVAIFVASALYIDRIILRSLKVDKIVLEGRYGYESSLTFMVRKDKMVLGNLCINVMDNAPERVVKSKPYSKSPSLNLLMVGRNPSVSGLGGTERRPSVSGLEGKERRPSISGRVMTPSMKTPSSSSLFERKASTKKRPSVSFLEPPPDLLTLPGVELEPIVDEFDTFGSEKMSSIFLFNSPRLFFRALESLLLFQCFYIAMVATQLIPLSLTSNHNASWIIGFIIPIGFNLYIIQMTLNKAVLLRSVYELEREIAGKICEDAIEEKGAIANLREVVFKALTEEGVPENKWKEMLQTYFFRYDTRNKGVVGMADFQRILGDLTIYMSREHFRLLWDAVDYDLSGGLDREEIHDIFFPDDKKSVELDTGDLPATKELRTALQTMLQAENIPMYDWENYLHASFDNYDADKSGLIDLEEFEAMLLSLGIILTADMIVQFFNSVDQRHHGNISYDDFFGIIFPGSVSISQTV